MKNTLSILFGLSLCFAVKAQAQGSYGYFDSGPFYCFASSNGTITLIRISSDTAGTVTIPSTINGFMVTTIGNNCCLGDSQLSGIIIPNTVTNIGNEAFASTGLTNLVIPDSVTSLGNSCFLGDSNLSGIIISDAVTSIGNVTFASTGLTNVALPDSVTNVDEGAFANCRELTNIVIGSGVLSIGMDAFQNAGLLSVTIPNGVVSIDVTAFWFSPDLVATWIGSGVTNIGLEAFAACSSLTQINVDSNNPAYSSAAGVLFDKNQTELIEYPIGNPSVSYTVPGRVGTIDQWAFTSSVHLTQAILNDGLTSIGPYAFLWCTNLASVTVPSSVTDMGYQAFSGCPNLTNAVLEGSGMGEQAFLDCSNLTAVSFGTNVSFIPPAAFEGTAVSRITIPTSVIEIGDSAFESTPLTNLLIPGSVDYIGQFAFAACTNLANVTVEDGLVYLDEQAFGGCLNLAHIALPASLTNIGAGAFFGTGLTTLALPPNVRTIGPSAFLGTGLTTLTIPASVNDIGGYAFAFCANLKTLYFQGDAPALGADALDGVNATVYCIPERNGWSNTYGGLPVVALNGAAFTAAPINGVAPLSVAFTGPSTDDSGHSITNWQWQLGDGSASTAQNPSHVYALGTFYPSLIATNDLGLAVFGYGPLAIEAAAPFAGLPTNIVLYAPNVIEGQGYAVLTSDSLALPLNQWTHLSGGTVSAFNSWHFTVTLTNAVNPNIPCQFYLIQPNSANPVFAR